MNPALPGRDARKFRPPRRGSREVAHKLKVLSEAAPSGTGAAR